MIPRGTGLPSAASVRGLDKNHPADWMMGAVLRYSRTVGGRRLFICEVPDLGRMGPAQLRGEVAEEDIELLDMPVDSWPEPGNVAP